MMRPEQGFDIIMFEKITGPAGVFSKNKVNTAEYFYCPVGNVFEVADWSRDKE